jgi:hypothetical protein
VYAVEGLSREGARGAGVLKADVASSSRAGATTVAMRATRMGADKDCNEASTSAEAVDVWRSRRAGVKVGVAARGRVQNRICSAAMTSRPHHVASVGTTPQPTLKCKCKD